MRLRSIRNSSVAILLSILAIDAFRTVFESAYFGLYFGSIYGYIPVHVHEFLSNPAYLLIPKFINMAAAIIVLLWLLKFWIPHEIQERASFADEFNESNRLLDLTTFSINQVADSLFWVSPEGKILEVNDTTCRKLGYNRNELQAMYVYDIDPDFTQDKWPAHWDDLKASKNLHFTSKHLTKQGVINPVDITTSYVKHGDKEYACAVVRDISDKAVLDKIIWRQANYDELTDLANRRLFNDRLSEAILSAKREQSIVAIVFIDLDHFKDINDTHGHDFGDQVLKEVAFRFKQILRESDTLARFAGDEFAAILTKLDKPEVVEILIDRMLNAIIHPMQLGDTTFHLTASIGVTFYPNDADTSEKLLMNADQAMYQAKDDGRNQIHYFTAKLSERLNWRITLLNELRDAIIKNQLQLFYQPIVDLKSHKTLKVEALIRWNHPTRGLVSPVEFIPVAEETSLIIDLGNWVVNQAIKDLKTFKEYDENMVVGINTSPAHYKHENCIDIWFNNIKDSGLTGKDFIFEITERILMPSVNNEIDKTLEKIHLNGIRTAIDDFGTGYSSLSYIKKYNIDYIKIDKSFIDNITTDSHDQAICEAVTVMSHKLGMTVIAEGVETEEQLKAIEAIGCDFAQGYYFAKPMQFDSICNVLSDQSNSSLNT